VLKVDLEAEKPYVDSFALALSKILRVGMVRVNRGVMACLAD